jgi:cobalt-zinc-cadmium efflux system membrane fusion protein
MVKLGDAVVQGQPVLALESPDADAAMSTFMQAQAGVVQATAALQKAQADFDRVDDLFEHNAVAKKEVTNAESTLTQAKAAVEQAQALREQALRRIRVLGLEPGDFRQQLLLRSPLAGKVLELGVVPGEYRNDTSAPVVTIADLRTVWVTSNVPESYIRFIHLGERMDVSLVAYPGETFESRVSLIANTVDPQTRTVKVQAEIDNRAGRLRPEMFGSSHHIEATTPTPVVPAGAVIEGDGRSAVFVERGDGRFERRDVTLGRPAGNLVRVIGGLRPGDRVVIEGTMLLKMLASKSS